MIKTPRAACLSAGLLMACATGNVASAASNVWPVGTALGGVGLTAPEGSECIVLPVGSSSLITGANTFLNLPSTGSAGGLIYIAPLTAPGPFTFLGAAHLTFKTPTSGVATFDTYYAQHLLTQPMPPAPKVSFSDYDAKISIQPPTLNLRVTFEIEGCKATLRAIYHQP